MPESFLDIWIRTRKKGSAAAETARDLKELKGGLAGAIEGLTGLSISSLGVGAVIAGTGAFIRAATVATAEYAREVADTARITGMSYEESSKFLQIADDLLVSNETLKQAFKEMNDSGIQPNIANIKELATEYQALETPVEKAQFAMDVFGKKAGPEMQKMLEQTPDALDDMAEAAEKAGLVIGEDLVAAEERMRKAQNDINDRWEAFKIRVGSEVLPILADLMEATTETVDKYANMTDGLQENEEALRKSNITYEEYKAMVIAAAHAQGLWVDEHGQLRQGQLNVLDSTYLLTEAGREVANVSENATSKFDDMATSLENNVKPAIDDTKASTDLLSIGLEGLTTKQLFNKVAAGLNAEQSMLLAHQMGLIDEAALSVQVQLDLLTAKYDLNHDGVVDAKEATWEYLEQVRDLARGIDGLPDFKTVHILTVFESQHIGEDGFIPEGMGIIPTPQSIVPKPSDDVEYRGEFATGGDFVVGGSGGTDSQLVMFKATPGEPVTVGRPGNSNVGGAIIHPNAININIYPSNGSDARSIAVEVRRELDQAIRNARNSGMGLTGE